MRHALAVFVCWTILAAACGPGAQTPTTTSPTTVVATTTSTTPTTSPTTTTTIAVDGASPDLARFVRATLDGEPAPGPDELTSALADLAPEEVEAATATVAGRRVAVVIFDDAPAGAVEGDAGWAWVGGRVGSVSVWPSLPAVFAVVGSDARPGEDPTHSRADSIHLIGLSGDGSASMLGIPRDSYVPIPGHGQTKINASLALGGPELMMETLRQVTGIDVQGYALTGFVGFQEMVGNVLGGFDMEVPSGFRDRASGAAVEAGVTYFNGPNALAFSRARKAFGDGDFTRQLNGGLVLLGALGAVKIKGPLSIPGLLESSSEWLATDLEPGDLLELSLAAADLDLGRVSNQVIPGTTASRGGASVVLVGPGAAGMFEDLADGAIDPG